MQTLRTFRARTLATLALVLLSSCGSSSDGQPDAAGTPTATSDGSSASISAGGGDPSATTTASMGVGASTTGDGSNGTSASSMVSNGAGGASTSGATTSATSTTGDGTTTTGQGGAVSTSAASSTGGTTPTPSAGCGVPWTPSDLEIEEESWRGPAGQVVRRELEVAGVTRRYMVVVPLDYDENLPYTLIFAFHGLGGDREQLRGYMNLEAAAAGAAVVIYPEGLVVQGSDTGWDLNADSDDLGFVDALFDEYTAELCIDEERVFATGHSYGGCMSNSVGCFRGDRFRGIAPVAGCGPFGRASCTGQVAAMIIHSPLDTTTPYSDGIQGCDTFLSRNSCEQSPECGCHWVEALDQPDDECVQQAQEPYPTRQTIEVGGDDEGAPVLRQYLACDPGFPVVQIDHYNGRDPRFHNPPEWAPAVIWEFFDNLPEVN
ncbi:MAG TPA: prolyl oligopeptidase family serine peptidase [Polyangiaceae bacterium]|nr:prolyl oligopeptidase family serine peptidase [Polyangiaceae bacterium]